MVQDALVVFVDIAPDNEELLSLANAASKVVVLDHHLSARDRFESDLSLQNQLAEMGHEVHFDLEHSGAMLSWQYFHPQTTAPMLLQYVQDQDLWHWQLEASREVNAAIDSHEMSFESWDELSNQSTESLAAEGAPIVRANRLAVSRAAGTASPVALKAGRIEAVNANHCRSQIGHTLAERGAFGNHWGLVYRLMGDRVDCSIYSLDDLDVSKVARSYGGGGHRNASGFTVSLREWIKLLV